MAHDHNTANRNDNDNNDLFNKIVDSDPFLKGFLASSRPIVEAMTKEERDCFVNRLIEIGKGE